ncbi:MAG: hypothetical protein FH748_15365 [Balneolaceae bacterium]|nr:hypothetical protein [Balneolaceae bacterium]
MSIDYKWKNRNILTRTCDIFFKNKHIGFLNNNSLSSSAIANLNGEQYHFETKGIFKQHTSIIDVNAREVVGQISYNLWVSKATVSLMDQDFHWKYLNLFNTEWKFHNNKGTEVHNTPHDSAGYSLSSDFKELLFLSGLYIDQWYKKLAYTIMAVGLATLIFM